MKRVQFNLDIVVNEYYQEVPCLQEYLANWDESKKIHLQQRYLQKTGSLEGFDLSVEQCLSDKEDSKIALLEEEKFAMVNDDCEIEKYICQHQNKMDRQNREDREAWKNREDRSFRSYNHDHYDQLCLHLLMILIISTVIVVGIRHQTRI